MSEQTRVLSVRGFWAKSAWFCRESRAYIGPYTLRDRLRWPVAWLRFMWFSRADWWTFQG